jgi:anti-sigma factor RsiW
MTEDKIKSEEGAALWRRLRQDAAPLPEQERPGDALLAAYLDGRLTEAEAAGLEARLAGDTELLDELLVLRESLAAEAAPAGLVGRAQALSERPAKARPVTVQAKRWPDRLFGDWLRPAVPAFAALALVVACAGAFEMGRYQFEQLEATEPAAAGDSDVPVDLLLDGFI